MINRIGKLRTVLFFQYFFRGSFIITKTTTPITKANKSIRYMFSPFYELIFKVLQVSIK